MNKLHCTKRPSEVQAFQTYPITLSFPHKNSSLFSSQKSECLRRERQHIILVSASALKSNYSLRNLWKHLQALTRHPPGGSLFVFFLPDIRSVIARLEMKHYYKKQRAKELPGRRPDVHQASRATIVG